MKGWLKERFQHLSKTVHLSCRLKVGREVSSCFEPARKIRGRPVAAHCGHTAGLDQVQCGDGQLAAADFLHLDLYEIDTVEASGSLDVGKMIDRFIEHDRDRHPLSHSCVGDPVLAVTGLLEPLDQTDIQRLGEAQGILDPIALVRIDSKLRATVDSLGNGLEAPNVPGQIATDLQLQGLVSEFQQVAYLVLQLFVRVRA